MAHRPLGMILTAGFGTRLYPLTALRPKPIMEIAGKPIIHYLIKMLERAGIRDIILNLHHQPEQVRRVVEQGDFKARIHLIYEKEILGTAGGIANVLRSFGIKDRQMVVLHGDIFCDIDLTPYVALPDFCTLICAKDLQVSGYKGSVGVNARDEIVELGRFYKSHEESLHHGFFTGIHILSPSAISLLQKCTENSLVAEVYPKWLREGHTIKGKVIPLKYDDLGTPARIFATNMSIIQGMRCDFVEPFEGLKETSPGIFRGAGGEIDATATLIAPLVLESGVSIGKHVRLGPNVIVGKDSVINDRAIIENSVILSETIVEKDEHIDCMIALRSARVLVKS